MTGDSFRQQRMAAWQPIMTPLKIVLVFIAAGIIFIPTGVSIMNSQNNVSHSLPLPPLTLFPFTTTFH